MIRVRSHKRHYRNKVVNVESYNRKNPKITRKNNKFISAEKYNPKSNFNKQKIKYEDIFKKDVVFQRYVVNDDLSLSPCKASINPYTLILKTKNERTINNNHLKKCIGCLIDVTRTPINQDIEVYKKL